MRDQSLTLLPNPKFRTSGHKVEITTEIRITHFFIGLIGRCGENEITIRNSSRIACFGFMMYELSLRDVDVQQARSDGSQTYFDVATTYDKRFVETTQQVESI